MKPRSLTCFFANTAAVLLAVCLVGCESTQLVPGGDIPPARIPEVVEPKPIFQGLSNQIEVGDTLELFVKEDRLLDGTYPVREQGDIIIPSIGRISVTGMTTKNAGKQIEGLLEKSQLTEATVIVDRIRKSGGLNSETDEYPAENIQKIKVYMTGKVNRPGQHFIPVPANGKLGVYDAILITGGISKFGDSQKVHILRAGSDGKKHKIPVNIRMIEKGLANDPPIGNGDIVVVPEKVFGF